MRKQIKPSKDTGGPLGVRASVWLIAFAVLVCVLTLTLSSHRATQPNSDSSSEISHEESVTHNTAARRPSRVEYPLTTSGNEASWDFDEAQLTMIRQMTEDRDTWWDHNY
jgi:hypothetical protein